MEADDRSSTASAGMPSGGLIRFRSHLREIDLWIAPAWSLLCGVVAAEGFRWRAGSDWLRLALLVLLVDAGWGTLWGALANTNWAARLSRWRSWRLTGHVVALPYTHPGTPGQTLSNRIAELREWWREELRQGCGPAISSILVAIPACAVFSALLGPEFLLLSAGALATMQLGVVWERGTGQASPGWDAIIAVLLPWLAGHLAFAPLALSSVALAIAATLAHSALWSAHTAWGRFQLVAAHAFAMATLLVVRVPLAAVAIGVLLVPQLVMLPRLRDGCSLRSYARYARVWWLAATLLAGWAL